MKSPEIDEPNFQFEHSLVPPKSSNVFPTPWQRKTIWTALATLAVVAIGAVAVGLIWLTSHVLGFLQPILIPFAVAAVMAYLLEPVVARLVRWGASRNRAVLYVFAVVSIGFVGMLLWVIPTVSSEAVQLARKLPSLTQGAQQMVTKLANDFRQKYNVQILPEFPPRELEVTPTPTPVVASTPGGAVAPPAPVVISDPAATLPMAPTATSPLPPPSDPAKLANVSVADQSFDLQQLLSGDWVRTALPTVIAKMWNFIRTSVGGFLGVFGFLLSMIIVPIYLFYFLIESRNIQASWDDYLPLRASHFKDEVVETLEEINGYLIAFFRGQLVVSMINGVATGVCLAIVGLDFGVLIGIMLCVLGIIPYLGIALCWIPAVIIAALHGGSWLVPATPWWAFPLVVTGIFFGVQQIDGLFVTPKIVGESVGLHPVTVIFSVFVWSLLMGGLLGAILAVPMTATIKVLLRRYVWERRFMSRNAAAPEGSFAVQPGQIPAIEHER